MWTAVLTLTGLWGFSLYKIKECKTHVVCNNLQEPFPDYTIGARNYFLPLWWAAVHGSQMKPGLSSFRRIWSLVSSTQPFLLT